MDHSKYNYAEEVCFSLDKLDLEWRRQPELVVKYNEARADANRVLDEAKERLELLIAENDIDLREQAEAEGKKVTEKSIEKMLLLAPDVQEAKAEVIKARHTVNLLSAACAGFDARGQALSNAVKLYTSSYFAEPAADIEARGHLDKAYSAGAASMIQIGRRSKPTEQTDEGGSSKSNSSMRRKK